MPARRKPVSASPAPVRDGAAASISGAAFWALMDRWQLDDDTALRLISGPPLTSAGTRPRFRLVGEQAAIFQQLVEIDRHVVDIFGEVFTWLTTANPAPTFTRRTPVEHMLRNGTRGVADVLKFLDRQMFKASL